MQCFVWYSAQLMPIYAIAKLDVFVMLSHGSYAFGMGS